MNKQYYVQVKTIVTVCRVNIVLVLHLVHEAGNCLSAVLATQSEVKAHMATYFWFVLLLTVNGRPLTGSTNIDSG